MVNKNLRICGVSKGGWKENQGERRFIQRDVYTNHVRIYHQIGGICEVSSDIPKLYENQLYLNMKTF